MSIAARDHSSNEMKARSLALHVQSKLIKSLEKWGGTNNEKEALASAIVQGIERDLQDTVQYDNNKIRNRVYIETGDTIAKAFSIHSNNVSSLFDGSLTVSNVVRNWNKSRQQAQKVYEDITVHHQRLLDASTKSSERTKNCAEVTSSSFDAYADAAKSMGDRVWVAEANRYMFNFCINYFRFGGYRKLFMKHWVGVGAGRDKMVQHKATENPCSHSDNKQAALAEKILQYRLNFDVFSKDICRYRGDKRVRLLDVGSCYNPFLKLDEDIHHSVEPRALGVSESFAVGDPYPLLDQEPVEKTFDRYAAVTALDLHPSTPASVYSCDFLELQVGAADSEPVIVANACEESVVSRQASPLPLGAMVQLPAHSYDAITMCLVLCYLPSPAQRLAMITKARKLLRNPLPTGSLNDNMHSSGTPFAFPVTVAGDVELQDVLRRYYSDSGLLVIAEKESIVGSAKNNASSSSARARPSPSAPPVTELLDHWKDTISQCGFECIRYHNVMSTVDKHKYHLFVFKTVVLPIPTSGSVPPVGLYIRQDYVNVCASDTASVSSSEASIRAANSAIVTEFGVHAAKDVSSNNSGPASLPLASATSFAGGCVFGSEPSFISEFVLEKPEIRKLIAREEKNKTQPKAAVPVDAGDGIAVTDASPLKVGIIGAGIGGLTLGYCLQQLRIPYCIYERDASVSSRRQGYGLTLQQANGVLKALDLYKHIQAGGDSKTGKGGVVSTSHASYTHLGELLGAYGVDVEAYAQESGRLEKRPEFNNDVLQSRGKTGTGRVITAAAELGEDSSESGSESESDSYSPVRNSHNKRGRVVKNESVAAGASSRRTSSFRQNYHIPRQSLREILLENTKIAHSPVGNIFWSKRLVGLASTTVSGGDDKLKLSFHDGSTDEVDVLVGADGIFSSVRQQMELKLPTEAVLSRSHNLGQPLKYLDLMVILGIAPRVDVCADSIADTFANGTANDSNNVQRRSQHQWLDGRPASSPPSHAFGSNCRVFTMPYDQQRTMWQVSFITDEASAKQYSSATNNFAHTDGANMTSATGDIISNGSVGDNLKQLVLSLVDGWPAPLLNLIRATPSEVVTGYPIYDRDPPVPVPVPVPVPATVCSSPSASLNNDGSAVIQEDKHTDEELLGRCVLIGDAAHPMSPFKGQGANQAVIDAYRLSQVLDAYRTRQGPDVVSPLDDREKKSIQNNAHSDSPKLSEALRTFEQDMYARVTPKVLKSRAAAQYLHSASGLVAGNITRAAAASGMKSPFDHSDMSADSAAAGGGELS